MSNERNRLIKWAKQLADPNWCLSVPKEAKETITALVKELEPRVISTEEELEELPVGSVIKDRDRDVCQRFRTGWRATIHEEHDDPWLTDTMEIDLPATVLYEAAP